MSDYSFVQHLLWVFFIGWLCLTQVAAPSLIWTGHAR